MAPVANVNNSNPSSTTWWKELVLLLIASVALHLYLDYGVLVRTHDAVSNEVEKKVNDDSQRRNSNSATTSALSCDKHGGPPDEIAAEMVYWRQFASDPNYTSPFQTTGPKAKYLTFQPGKTELVYCALYLFLCLSYTPTHLLVLCLCII